MNVVSFATDWATLSGNITVSGGNSVIDLGDDSLTLMRVKPWQLDADDFAFS